MYVLHCITQNYWADQTHFRTRKAISLQYNIFGGNTLCDEWLSLRRKKNVALELLLQGKFWLTDPNFP